MTAKKVPATSAAKKAPAKSSAKAPPATSYETGKWASAFAPRKKGETRYWLVKSEPDTFSFDDLMAAKNRTTFWNGVRNVVARNFLRDGMKKGDKVFFYHSMTDPSAVVGICEVVREGYPDDTAFDTTSEYYDERSSRDKPTWYMVDLKAVKRLANPVTLHRIKRTPSLAEMTLVRISRLSVTPVTPDEWETIVRLSESAE
jgi:predicted RNA-binding protein with PUA-like domain